MSCEVRMIACIEDVPEIRKTLFPFDNQRGTDSWLQLCKIALSPARNLVVIANERKIVVLAPKWDTNSSMNFYQILYSGSIHECDKVKAIVCLSVGGKNDNTHNESEWTCIVIGFDSGYVRFYTENCDMIYEEQFNAENITTITCRFLGNIHPEEVYIHYKNTICTLNGFQLISFLKICYNQILEYNKENLPLLPLKWEFQDQSLINDSVVVGLNLSNTFDHLLTASTCGGFYSKYRAMPPNNTLVIAAGSKPYLGYHYALEGGGQPVLSDVAKAVASKLKSTLPSWLMGNKSSQERQMSFAAQPAEPMGCRFGICDLRRTATDIILSPDHKLAAVCDTLGRISLIDSFKGIVLKMFKGYREAQCSFIQILDEKRSKHKGVHKSHFLAIYSPKKGTIEIFSVQQGSRIAIFSASKYSWLLYVKYGPTGFPSSLKSKVNCQYTSLFIDNDGFIKEFLIPFHITPSEKSNKRARDIHLYKKFRHVLKTGTLENEKLLNEALNTCSEIKTNEIKCQFVELLLQNKHLPAEISLNCVQYFINNLDGEDNENLKRLCQNSKVLLELYIFLSNACTDNYKNVKEDNEYSLNIDIKEMTTLKKLLDISVANIPELHIKFLDNLVCSASDFVSLFDYSSSNSNTIKSKMDNNIVLKVSEVIFKNYIDGCFKNYLELKDKLTESKIPTNNLIDLLLNYWFNRSFNINSILEDEILHLSTLLNIILNISKKDIFDAEYCEVSEFWSGIRNKLTDSPKPFLALIAAIICKDVAQKFMKKIQVDESGTTLDDMEVLTQEDIEWTLLIGKLEDISLLNIILLTKPSAKDCHLPKLKYEKVDISLKYILQKGNGTISELVAKWLTTTGVNPEYIVLNESLSVENDQNQQEQNMNDTIKEDVLLTNLNLMRRQFPSSLQASFLVTNMSWEYASAWQRDIQDLSLLQASINCMKNVQNLQIKQGLHQVLWNTHLKIVSENTCKLINKAGKLPKERLCKQDIGLTDYQVSMFLSISTDFLDSFIEAVNSSCNSSDNPNFENIWNGDEKSLVELAVKQKCVNFELLFLHYQLSLVLLMISNFPIKYLKPMNNLFEASVVNLFFTDLQRNIQISSNKSDIRLNSSRNQFLHKIILASIESVTANDSGKIYSTDHVFWMAKCLSLGKFWNLDVNELRSYQVVQLFSSGFDSLAEELITAVNKNPEFGKDLLRVACKRLSQFLVASPELSENISALSPLLTKYMETLNDEWCVSTPLKDVTVLATYVLQYLTEDDKEYQLATMLLDACRTLEEIKS